MCQSVVLSVSVVCRGLSVQRNIRVALLRVRAHFTIVFGLFSSSCLFVVVNNIGGNRSHFPYCLHPQPSSVSHNCHFLSKTLSQKLPHHDRFKLMIHVFLFECTLDFQFKIRVLLRVCLSACNFGLAIVIGRLLDCLISQNEQIRGNLFLEDDQLDKICNSDINL